MTRLQEWWSGVSRRPGALAAVVSVALVALAVLSVNMLPKSKGFDVSALLPVTTTIVEAPVPTAAPGARVLGEQIERDSTSTTAAPAPAPATTAVPPATTTPPPAYEMRQEGSDNAFSVVVDESGTQTAAASSNRTQQGQTNPLGFDVYLEVEGSRLRVDVTLTNNTARAIRFADGLRIDLPISRDGSPFAGPAYADPARTSLAPGEVLRVSEWVELGGAGSYEVTGSLVAEMPR